MPTKALSIVNAFLDPLEPLLLEPLVARLSKTELGAFRDQLKAELEAERKELQNKVSQSKYSSLDILEFERNLDYLVSKSFLRDTDNTKLELPDVMRYVVGHIFFCKNSIKRVLDYMIGDFGEMLENKQSAEAEEEGPGWTRIGRYSRMLRYFVRFLQERAILRELIQDYDYWFETVIGLVAGRSTMPEGRRPGKQYMQLDDFAAASRDLLLEGTTGRFASPPLIRAVIELALTRSLLELPKYSSKHKSKTIQPTRTFRVADLITACGKKSVNITLNPSNLLVEAVYKWGNETVHDGITFPMEEIVFSHSIVDDLAHGRLGPMFKAESLQIDSLLDELEQAGEIIVT
jgi:hypothetical protein